MSSGAAQRLPKADHVKSQCDRPSFLEAYRYASSPVTTLRRVPTSLELTPTSSLVTAPGARHILASPATQTSYSAMYMPSQPSSHCVPKSSIWQQRRPDFTLNRLESPSGSYKAVDDLPYPSPPMSDSPSSPRRPSQLPEERTSGSFTSPEADLTTSSSGQTARSTMAAQVLLSASPRQPYAGSHGAILDPMYDLQPRPPPLGSNAPIGPQYPTGYPIGPVGAPAPLLQAQPVQPYMPPAAYSGPTSLTSPTGAKIHRPSRRTKAHVAKACQNCKKAHLSCNEARPCARCVASGKQVRLLQVNPVADMVSFVRLQADKSPVQATCVDVEHKKRGRPRLRDDRERPEQGSVPTSFAPAPPPNIARTGGHSRGGSLDYQRRTRSNSTRQQPVGLEPPRPVQTLPQPDVRAGTVTDIFYSPQEEPSQGPSTLVAFLNLDLRILKCNDPFRNVFTPSGDPTGRLLSDFVDGRHSLAVARLQNGLREERTQREPTFLPGIFPEQQERQAVEALDQSDVEKITQGFEERPEQWTFVLHGGQPEVMYSRVKLAKTSTYFAIITIRRIAPLARGNSRPRGSELGAGGFGQVIAPPQPSPTHPPRYPAEARSPFRGTPPPSPFSSLIGLGSAAPLPPSYGTMGSVQPRSDQGYFARSSSLLASPLTYMQPPPQPIRPPSATSDPRPSSARERPRPEPLGSLQLPPIVSSAPTTPLISDFFHQTGPVQAGRADTRIPERGEPQEPQEESSRKRRRMDITDIVDR